MSFSGPAAIRKFAIQHRYRGLCFRRDAERQVYFGETQPGFLDMPRRLKARHHRLEAIEGPDVVALVDFGATDI